MGGALGHRQAVIDDLLLAVGPEPEGHQHRAADGAGAGLARKHHAIEHQDRVDVLERPAVEGGDRRIQGLGDLAHRGRADPPAEDRQQGDGDLAGAEPKHEAGQDHAVDMGRAAGVGAHHRERAPAPGARHAKLDLSELGHQPAAIAAVAPVGFRQPIRRLQMAIDPGRHPTLQNVLQGRGGGGAIVLAPFDPLRLHGLHHPERMR